VTNLLLFLDNSPNQSRYNILVQVCILLPNPASNIERGHTRSGEGGVAEMGVTIHRLLDEQFSPDVLRERR
jgi:hypothetical protein